MIGKKWDLVEWALDEKERMQEEKGWDKSQISLTSQVGVGQALLTVILSF